MATCKDCLHLDVCYMVEHYGVDPTEDGQERDCDQFKARTSCVPVVRCKDCIHYYEREPVCLKIYSDGAVSANAWQERKPDDFCSYGERKDGAEDG